MVSYHVRKTVHGYGNLFELCHFYFGICSAALVVEFPTAGSDIVKGFAVKIIQTQLSYSFLPVKSGLSVYCGWSIGLL